MPGYISNPQPTQLVTLFPGQQIALVNNGATDSGITNTLQIALAQISGLSSKLTVINTTGDTATPQVSWHDVSGDYEPLTDADTGQAITVGGASAVTFDCFGPWIRFHFASAPTSGSLVLCR